MAERGNAPLSQDLYAASYAMVLAPLCRGTVLDIGCGEGWVTERIAQEPAVVDIYACDKYNGPQRQHPKIYYDCIRTEELISAPQWQAYDTVICTEHIEHLEEEFHRPLLAWIREALKPGGQFLGSMPDCETNFGPYHKHEYRLHNWEPVLKEFFPNSRVWSVQSTVYVWQAHKT